MNALIIIVIIISLILIAGLFIKKDYTLQKEIVINKPLQDVFDYVKHLGNQRYYNKWVMADPNMKLETKGVDGTVGFVLAWDSKKGGGKGEEEITTLNEGDSILYDIRFEKPFEGKMEGAMRLKSVSTSQTKLVWTTDAHLKYPMTLTRVFTDGMLKKDMELSLNNLKNILENNNY